MRRVRGETRSFRRGRRCHPHPVARTRVFPSSAPRCASRKHPTCAPAATRPLPSKERGFDARLRGDRRARREAGGTGRRLGSARAGLLPDAGHARAVRARARPEPARPYRPGDPVAGRGAGDPDRSRPPVPGGRGGRLPRPAARRAAAPRARGAGQGARALADDRAAAGAGGAAVRPPRRPDAGGDAGHRRDASRRHAGAHLHRRRRGGADGLDPARRPDPRRARCFR